MQQAQQQEQPGFSPVEEFAAAILDMVDLSCDEMTISEDGTSVSYHGDSFHYELGPMYLAGSGAIRAGEYTVTIPNAADDGGTQEVTVESVEINGKRGIVVYDVYHPTSYYDEDWVCSGMLKVILTDAESHPERLKSEVARAKSDAMSTVKGLAVSLLKTSAEGQDLANLVNEAALFAARSNKRLVDMDDFERAKDKIIMGAERRSIVMPEEERRNTAYHESGHAVVARLLPKTDPVHKVTIIPRGRALGVTMQLPTEDRYSMDKERMLCTIAVLFGGRIAEEIFMNQMTTGASNDFERATAIARDMVTRYGMTEALGPMVYAENEGEVFLGRSVTKTTHMSEQTMQMVDAEIRKIIDSQYKVAWDILDQNRDKVHTMAKALLEWETIDADQINDIMDGKDPRPPSTGGSTPPTGGSPSSSGGGGEKVAPAPQPAPAAMSVKAD